MIITIDGPAGSGKSSTAREVARRLGYHYLDSGAFYRALTWAILEAGIPFSDWGSLTPGQLDGLAISARPDRIGYRLVADDRDITAEIRSPEVNASVSRVAALPAVREWLLGRLRAAAASGNLVTDGRDMGTVVFPAAELKIFLVADPAVRARRRLLEQGQDPVDEDIAAEVARLQARDRADSDRETAPLRKAEDAIEIDTSHVTLEEQIERIVGHARLTDPSVSG